MFWNITNQKLVKGNYLFRFLSKDYLEAFLETGDLWFARADKFGDKMECFRIGDYINNDYSAIHEIRQKHLICCFHNSNIESLALWDVYKNDLKDRRLFAIKFKLKDLIQYVEKSAVNDFNKLYSSIGRITYFLLSNKTSVAINLIFTFQR